MAVRVSGRPVVGAVILLGLWLSDALASPLQPPQIPLRGKIPRPTEVYWEPGRLSDVLRVKVRGVPRWPDLAGARAEPLGRLAGWYTIRSSEAEAIGTELLADPAVETAFLAYAPMPPPGDDGLTDDFRADQTWLDAFPGLGFPEAARWPGGTGANVRIADVEYGWDPAHEDLVNAPAGTAWGANSNTYVFHGNSVIGMFVGTVNGFGVDGAVPDATMLVVSPYEEGDRYDVAAAVDGATAILEPGDVLLIEQQAARFGMYCPISVDPAVFEAIARATEAGILVIEPSGNGAADHADPDWEGWIDRALHASGSIIVGGGGSPESGFPRGWMGSSYGSRIDLQGWYDSIVTATSGDFDGYYADLYFPGEDPLRAYTRTFSGTSGASPMVAAAAAIAQSIAIEMTGSGNVMRSN
jgi:hypothetical protein